MQCLETFFSDSGEERCCSTCNLQLLEKWELYGYVLYAMQARTAIS
jgi:hypothetical protein